MFTGIIENMADGIANQSNENEVVEDSVEVSENELNKVIQENETNKEL